MTIYNCWNKTIKYIYFTALPINEVGDVERDYRGNVSASKKLIGPIEPGEMYNFRAEKLFYYDNDIKKLVLSSMSFEFTDGTIKKFDEVAIKNRHLWRGEEKKCLLNLGKVSFSLKTAKASRKSRWNRGFLMLEAFEPFFLGLS